MDELGRPPQLRKQLREFADSLRIAIYDKQLETRGHFEYFFDTDVLYRTILGCLVHRLSKPDFDTDAPLVRALLYVGQIGQIQMLLPHAMELESSLRNLLSPKDAQVGFEHDRDAFVRSENVHEAMQRLEEIISAKGNEQTVAKDAVEYLSSIAPHAFATFVNATGTWHQRLLHLWPLIKISREGQEVPGILQSKAMPQFQQAISAVRHGDRPMSTLQDAMAMSHLCARIAAREGGHDVPYVRFYSESTDLEAAWRADERIRQLLSYRDGVRPDESFCVRNSKYFIVRASFRALGFADATNSQEHSSYLSLEKLEELLEQIHDIVDYNEFGLEAEFKNRMISGKTIRDIVREYESLAFLRSVWIDQGLPGPVETLFPQWTAALDYIMRPVFAEQIAEQVHVVQNELGIFVKDMRQWRRNVQRIRSAAIESFRDPSEAQIIPDPKRDLGMIRWGTSLPPQHWDEIRNDVAALLQRDDQAFSLGCAALASKADRPRTPEACAVVCASLWTIQEFRWLVTVIERYKKATKNIPDYLLLLRAAALFRGRIVRTIQEKQKEIDVLQRRAESLRGEDRARFSLGLGYVLFFASQHSSLDQEQAPQSWISETFDVVYRMRDAFAPESIEKAFALNHCVYVGYRLNLRLKEADGCLKDLTGFRHMRNIWHYRFADTYAMVLFARAKQLWSQRTGEANPRVQDTVLETLSESERALKEAFPVFGDHEIDQHRMEIRNFSDEVRGSGAQPVAWPMT